MSVVVSMNNKGRLQRSGNPEFGCAVLGIRRLVNDQHTLFGQPEMILTGEKPPFHEDVISRIVVATDKGLVPVEHL